MTGRCVEGTKAPGQLIEVLRQQHRCIGHASVAVWRCMHCRPHATITVTQHSNPPSCILPTRSTVVSYVTFIVTSMGTHTARRAALMMALNGLLHPAKGLMTHDGFSTHMQHPCCAPLTHCTPTHAALVRHEAALVLQQSRYPAVQAVHCKCKCACR